MIALTAIMTGWMIARVVLWTPLFLPADIPREVMAVRAQRVVTLAEGSVSEPRVARRVGRWTGYTPAISTPAVMKRPVPIGVSAKSNIVALQRLAYALPSGKVGRQGGGALTRSRRRDAVASVGFARQRWSADGWLLLRDGGMAAQAPGAASYGASQSGAVVRYRLDSARVEDAYGYMRASFAINAPGGDREAALGLGVRPIAAVPLRALAEFRVQESGSNPLRLRPVIAVVTELPWQALPLGLRGEVYAQGGYAGGRNRTAFFDAQVLVDRRASGILPTGGELRLGAGAWAGGQKDATRLDAGPRVTLGVDPAGPLAGRIAIDWRFRLAGNARPGSGPALTVASSF